MNRFKNQVPLAAGLVALASVIGGILAAPAIAQVIKAALIKNVDEKGRVPFDVELSCLPDMTVNCFTLNSAPIPANHRYVVEYVTGTIQSSSAATDARFVNIYSATGSGTTAQAFLPANPVGSIGSTKYFIISEPVTFYINANESINANIFTGMGGLDYVRLHGYLVDLTI